MAEEEPGKVASNDNIETPGLVGGAMEIESAKEDIVDDVSESYCSKVCDSCAGSCFGFFLFFASISLLIWNEGRTVKQQSDIDEGRETIVEFDLNNFTNASIPTAFENQLVHAIGDLGTTDVLSDPIFGKPIVNSETTANTTEVKTENILKLMRSVEMYQWIESSNTTSEKELDGSTHEVTTYSYSKTWSSSVIDSSQFREQSSLMTNPGSLPFQAETFNADPIYLGNMLELEDAVVGAINWYEPCSAISLRTVPDATLRTQLSSYTLNGFFYRSNFTFNSSASSSNDPSVGDARITFDVVVPDTISIIAKLNPAFISNGSNSIGSYTTKRGASFLLIERGVYTAEDMFVQAEDENTATAWAFRFVGFFIMVISIRLILQPLATVEDIFPLVGEYIQSVMEGCLLPCIAILIAIPISLFVISIAWLSYRPYIAIPIAVVTSLIVIYICFRVRKNRLHQQQSQDSAIEAGAEKDINSDGFAGALDHPPLHLETNDEPADTKRSNAEIEDVIFK